MTHLQPTLSTYKFSNQACLIPANNTSTFTTNCMLANVCELPCKKEFSEENAALTKCRLKNKLIEFLSKSEVRNLLVFGVLILAFSYLYGAKTALPFKTKTNISNSKITNDEALNISPLVVPDKYMLQ
jgi:hypothetical protein